jgi:hypothetical protein
MKQLTRNLWVWTAVIVAACISIFAHAKVIAIVVFAVACIAVAATDFVLLRRSRR